MALTENHRMREAGRRGIYRGAIESAECRWCGDGEQSVLHLYTKCRKWRTERRALRKNPDKIGIQSQRRPERKWLAKLLANERAVGPILGYLKGTGVRGREGAEEKKNGVEAKKRLGRERITGGPQAPICGLKSGRQSCPRVEDGAKKQDRRGKAERIWIKTGGEVRRRGWRYGAV